MCLWELEITVKSRLSKFKSVKQSIVEAEGGLGEFAKSYQKYGLNKVAGGIQFREWLPGAQQVNLVGDFSKSLILPK